MPLRLKSGQKHLCFQLLLLKRAETLFFGRDIFFTTLGRSRDRKKEEDIVEIVQNQKDGRQIAPSRSPLKNLMVCEEDVDLTAVSDGHGVPGEILIFVTVR
jgi:hypothetical protein